jgi:hypothetical protein
MNRYIWGAFFDELEKLSSSEAPTPLTIYNQNNELQQAGPMINMAPQRFDMTKPPPKPPAKKDYFGSSLSGGLLGGSIGVKAGVGGAVTGAVLGAGTGSALTAMDDPNA